ncbi:MAG: FAD-dependent oxidoreductase [Gemmatimonadales bacterium]
MRPFRLLLLAALGSGTAPSLPAQAAREVDVLVYGGTSAGVIAAYTAKTSGKSVVLVEPGRHLGGMTSGGLGQTDIGNKFAVTGLALDFYRRVGRHYGWFEAWQFEPHVAARVFEQYVHEAGVEVWLSRRLRRVRKAGTRITQVELEDAGGGAGAGPLVVAARQFIDASYEGDLLAMAGASYVVGREANGTYGETLNGVQLRGRHQFPDGISPYVVPGDPSSGVVAGITGVGVAPNGAGHRGVQAYNFRMCLCQGGDRIPITRPDRYDPARYELLLRRIAAERTPSLDSLFIISRMPNGKTDWNNRGGFSTDYIGGNWDYPDADYARRAEIWREHEQYQKGLLYFLGHDPRVPAHLGAEMASWGYCRDEFRDTGGWPHQLYVREARRLVGEYVMTEHNSVGREVVDDGIALAAYTMDSHNVQRVVVNGMVKNEGNVEVGGHPWDDLGGAVKVAPYPIAYRSLTPKRREVTNLLVPVALSASHIAFGSIRMEPVYMVLGQVAAVAAVLAIDAGTTVQDVDVAALRRELRENPLADGSTPEVLVDDGDEDRVRVSGAWTRTAPEGKFGRTALRHDGDGPGEVRFRPEIARAGAYEVYLYWPRSETLSPSVPVVVRHAGGSDTIIVNMREPDAVHGGLQHGIVSWVRLGAFAFRPGREAYVAVRAVGNGRVYADAALLVPVREGR